MSTQRSKPSQLLTELEREPIVYFGCTWTEISRALYRSTIISLLTAIALAAVIWSLGLLFQIVFAISAATMFIMILLLTRGSLRGIAKHRVGKPLFYEKHIGTYRSNRFIQPQHIQYQRERNHASKK